MTNDAGDAQRVDKELLKLLRVVKRRSVEPEHRLEAMADGVDRAMDLRDAGALKTLIRSIRDLEAKPLGGEEKARLHYFVGTAYSELSRLDQADASAWENPNLEASLLYFKRAIASNLRVPDREWAPEVVFTNLAGNLSRVGRVVEAFDFWRAALRSNAGFGPAKANLAEGLLNFSAFQAGLTERRILLARAKELAEQAVRSPATEAHGMRAYSERILARVNAIATAAVTTPPPLSKDAYQTWCLKHNLYLNAVAVAVPDLAAPGDPLRLRRVRGDAKLGISPIGIFNVVKREFASARYFAFQAIAEPETKRANVDVAFVDTLDMPFLSHRAECGKAAYRAAYSAFDRIAVFLNAYFELGASDKARTFRSVWYIEGKRSEGLRHEFNGRRNWPLRGLFWVSKELYDVAPGYREATNPDAFRLDEVRNHLEHRYLSLHVPPGDFEDRDLRTHGTPLGHPIGLHLSWFTFRRLLLSLLGLAHEAIFYLAAAIELEEARVSEKALPQLPLSALDHSLFDIVPPKDGSEGAPNRDLRSNSNAPTGA